MDEFILEASHVSYAYEEEGAEALSDVSLSFRKGEMQTNGRPPTINAMGKIRRN